jgi:hypothetical protein
VRAQNAAAMMWRPADGSGGRGVREGGQQGRARAAGDVHATRGEGGSRRWSGGGLHSGDSEVLCTSGREGRGAEGCQRKKKEGGPGGCLEISRILGTSR